MRKKILNKSKLAKQLGISRPTLNKRLGSKEIIEFMTQPIEIELQKSCIKLSALVNGVSPIEIEKVLEFLSDSGMFNEQGKVFSSAYWRLFIQE